MIIRFSDRYKGHWNLKLQLQDCNSITNEKTNKFWLSSVSCAACRRQALVSLDRQVTSACMDLLAPRHKATRPAVQPRLACLLPQSSPLPIMRAAALEDPSKNEVEPGNDVGGLRDSLHWYYNTETTRHYPVRWSLFRFSRFYALGNYQVSNCCEVSSVGNT